MSKRAEDAAENIVYIGISYKAVKIFKEGVKAGYEQAEKDLALTWIDIRNILSIAREVEDENDDCPLLKSELCDEILRRFNEQRKK